MSVVHELLYKIEERENLHLAEWPEQAKHSNEKSGLFVFDLPKEIINDFYGLKEYIRIANKSGNIRVLSITSSVNGEGSSTISTYLSFLMAGGMLPKTKPAPAQNSSESLFSPELLSFVEKEEYSNVVPLGGDLKKSTEYGAISRDDILLVDANMENPSLHKYFGLAPEKGLGEMIEQNVDWREYIRPVQGSNLKIITAGKADTKSIELLGSDRFRTMVRQWRNQFKYVIIDTPPVLSSVESLSIASVSDGVILILCAGYTRWENAQSAKRKLNAAKANVLGVALNRRKMDIPDGLYKRLVV